MSTVIGFTGHRPPKCGGYSDWAYSVLVQLCFDHLSYERPDETVIGMAQGFDFAACEASLMLKIPVTAAVPFNGQELKWPVHTQLKYRELLSQCKSVVVSEHGYSRQKMQYRNEWIVDHVTKLLALWDGYPDGGTYNCIQYANHKKIPYKNLYDDWQQRYESAFKRRP